MKAYWKMLARIVLVKLSRADMRCDPNPKWSENDCLAVEAILQSDSKASPIASVETSASAPLLQRKSGLC
jgi:hypothetical protein